MPTSDEQLDALLDAADSADPDNSLAIFARIHERRRARQHAKHKAEQPDLGMGVEDKIVQRFIAEIHKPLTDDDKSMDAGAMDYLLLTVQAAATDGDFEDLIFALARVYRKCWAAQSHHLGPIEGVPAPKPA
jgi:hypothetical protein